MTQRLSIKQAYDIANAFITDTNTTINATVDTFSETPFMRFEFTNNAITTALASYQLVIFIPCGANDEYQKKQGEICLFKTSRHNNKTEPLFVAKTQNSVGRAIDRKQSDITRAFTRMLSPRFFKLVENTEKRISQKTEPTNNALKLFMEIYRIENNMR